MIETPRLCLRPWRAEDAKDLFASASDPDIGLACGWKPHHNEAESGKIIKDFLSREGTYAIKEKASGRVIGSVSLKKPEDSLIEGLDEGDLVLGYWIGKSWWDHGYATEAATALLSWAFEEGNASSVYASVFEGNERSRRVQEKLGMRYRFSDFIVVPQLRNAFMTNVMSITKDAFLHRGEDYGEDFSDGEYEEAVLPDSEALEELSFNGDETRDDAVTEAAREAASEESFEA